jgi:branched-chain amino acid transport system ATP-binding protein
MPDVDRGLHLNGLSVSYQNVEVVHGVDIDVAPGEAVAILGANGAGKSSILRAITGNVTPSAGTIRVNGVAVEGKSPTAIARSGVAHAPEGRRVFGTQSVADNLRVGGWTHRWKRGELEARVEEMFEQFPVLAERRRARASALSGGQAQMLSIAMALMSRPSILLLDEPSLGLAPVTIDAVVDEIVRLRETGVSILVSEENSVCGLAAATRAYVLRAGRVVLHGAADDLMDPEVLHDAYLGTQTGGVSAP